MTRIKLRYVDCYPDARGRVRHYFRRSRRSLRVALPGLPGSEEFMAAYQACLEGDGPQQPKRYRGDAGTFDRLVQDYFEESVEFNNLAASSKQAYRRVIERWLRDEKIGHRLVSQMQREHVEKMLVKRKATPGAANDLLKKIRILIGFAINKRLRVDDPTLKLKKFNPGKSHHTWTEPEVAAFEKRWPIGTTERMAFGLLLFTGQRRSDVVKMTWPDITDDGGWIKVVQKKTGTELLIPLHPNLKALLADWPKRHVVLLTTSFGKPFTDAGFGNWMADKIAAAGLPDRCVTHGLRKTAATRFADYGCSTQEIMAFTGHRSLKEVERYTRAAQQKRLAQQAMAKQVSGQIKNKDSLQGGDE